MTARHRASCPSCGKSAHPGQAIERVPATILNGGFAFLIAILRVPAG